MTRELGHVAGVERLDRGEVLCASNSPIARHGSELPLTVRPWFASSTPSRLYTTPVGERRGRGGRGAHRRDGSIVVHQYAFGEIKNHRARRCANSWAWTVRQPEG
ncbi:hypothetical protein WME75_44130 [Sorangium sp. So ce1014]|uniref:hypothetical protein n=1 Tax=Sorangium sp. So ce1014 TaxID=3133326 RepID=UPI003F5FE19C